MAKKDFEEFVRTYNGRAIDWDGAFGVQCVDGYNVYCDWLGIGRHGGNAIDLWHGSNSKHPGCSKTITQWADLQPGDILIWAQTPGCFDAIQGHVAMFRRWIGNKGGMAEIFGENQGGDNGAFSSLSVNKGNFLGAYRPDNIKGNKTLWTIVTRYGLIVDAFVQ